MSLANEEHLPEDSRHNELSSAPAEAADPQCTSQGFATVAEHWEGTPYCQKGSSKATAGHRT